MGRGKSAQIEDAMDLAPVLTDPLVMPADMLGSNRTINQPTTADAGSDEMQRPLTSIVPLIAPVLAFIQLGSAALAQDPARHGRALLKEFCGNCHAIGKTGASRMRCALPFRSLGRSFDLDHFTRQLERGIASGHPAMPEFKFSEDDARAASAYLQSIQK
jgi:cytochrome c